MIKRYWLQIRSTHAGFQITSKSGFFLDQDVGSFDAPFFSVTAKEAAGMDPHKRILLEVTYEAFENGMLILLPMCFVLYLGLTIHSWNALGQGSRNKNRRIRRLHDKRLRRHVHTRYLRPRTQYRRRRERGHDSK